jgi:hypothetical protein
VLHIILWLLTTPWFSYPLFILACSMEQNQRDHQQALTRKLVSTNLWRLFYYLLPLSKYFHYPQHSTWRLHLQETQRPTVPSHFLQIQHPIWSPRLSQTRCPMWPCHLSPTSKTCLSAFSPLESTDGSSRRWSMYQTRMKRVHGRCTVALQCAAWTPHLHQTLETYPINLPRP